MLVKKDPVLFMKTDITAAREKRGNPRARQDVLRFRQNQENRLSLTSR